MTEAVTFTFTTSSEAGALTGWRIGCGLCDFLVASGSAWSEPFGRALYENLRSGNLPAQIRDALPR